MESLKSSIDSRHFQQLDAFMRNSKVQDPTLRAELAAVQYRYPHLFHVNADCPRVLVLHNGTAGFGHTAAAIGSGLIFAIEYGAKFVIDQSFFHITTHGHMLANHLPRLLNLNFPEMPLIYSQSELQDLAQQYGLNSSSVSHVDDLRAAFQSCRQEVRATMAVVGFCGNYCPLSEPWTLFYLREVLLPLFHLQHPVSPFLNSSCIEVGIHFRAGDVHIRLRDSDFFATIFQLLESASFGFPCFHYTIYYAIDAYN